MDTHLIIEVHSLKEQKKNQGEELNGNHLIIKIFVVIYDNLNIRDVAQLGSAPLWGSGGRGFKSRRSDEFY